MMSQVLRFASKARRRGMDYVGAVSTYQTHAIKYRLVALSEQVGAGRSNAAESAEAPNPQFHFSPQDVPEIVRAIPESAKRLAIQEAGRYVGQRFAFRGLAEAHFPKQVDWDFLPDGNVSWSWDLNRHSFFLTLGTAYHYTHDEVYLLKLVELWDDWIRRNPVGRGLNWNSPFEAAARLRNWIWAYFLLRAAPEINPQFLLRAWTGLREHAAFLSDHLEYHWPNNHLLLEALTLCEFALVFRDSDGASYLPRAHKILVEQVERQVLADGVHGELCPMYHEIVAAELQAFAGLCRKLRFRLPIKTTERIAAMRRFSAAMRRSDGSFPLLGDSSPSDTCLRFGSPGSASGHLAFWALPEDEITGWPARKPLSVELFAAAGYAILHEETSRAHLVFDFGPWSRCKTNNHGHADALSFELHSAGRPWIVDSGFFHPWSPESVTGPDWARYFRSTTAHNTLLIDGREPFELTHYGDIRRQARTRLLGYRSDVHEVAVCGESQPCWSGGDTVHRREIVLKQSGAAVVRDSVSFAESLTKVHKLEWFLHFAPNIEVSLSGSQAVVARCGEEEMRCGISCTGPAPRLRLVRGQELPRQGWVAQSTAVVIPAWVLVVETETSSSCEIQFDFLLASQPAKLQAQEPCLRWSA